MLDRLSPWHIDPRHVQDEEARQRVVSRARSLLAQQDSRARSRQRRYLRLMLFVFGSLAALILTRTLARTTWSGVLLDLLPLLLIISAAVAAFFVQHWLCCRRFIRQALREVGDEPCVACGYQLRALPRSVIFCPECGAVRVAQS